MKQLRYLAIIYSTVILSNICLASTNPPANNAEEDLLLHGPYVGFEFGYSAESASNEYWHQMYDTGLFYELNLADTRPFLGYRFNDHVALEAGYRYVADVEDEYDNSEHYQVQGGDIQMMLNMMAGHYLNFYVKGGLAIMNADIKTHDFSTTETRVVPVVAAGADLVLAKRWTIGAIASYQSESDYIPSSTLYGFRTSFIF